MTGREDGRSNDAAAIVAAAMTDAELKPQVYKDPRPPETFDEFHARVRGHPPEWVYEAVRLPMTLHVLISFRARCFGLSLIHI